ncbi:HEBP2 [Scenedesmus sp. PABB004]|nr:HEBP2 [Scenedesmus sp. PABB004]
MRCVALALALGAAMMSSGAAAQAAANWAAPAFYKGLEGPKFTVLKSFDGGFELRRYEPASWVSTKKSAMELDQAMGGGAGGAFMKLFNYISGANAARAKIPMTAPVLTRVTPGQGPTCESEFVVNFYNPDSMQASLASVPKPTDPAVTITSLPALEVYVLPFGGQASSATWKAKAAELAGKLTAAKLPFDPTYWYTAGYDSPYTLTGRHNEVWLPAKAPAAASALRPFPSPRHHTRVPLERLSSMRAGGAARPRPRMAAPRAVAALAARSALLATAGAMRVSTALPHALASPTRRCGAAWPGAARGLASLAPTPLLFAPRPLPRRAVAAAGLPPDDLDFQLIARPLSSLQAPKSHPLVREPSAGSSSSAGAADSSAGSSVDGGASSSGGDAEGEVLAHKRAAVQQAFINGSLGFAFSAGGLVFPYYVGLVSRLVDAGVLSRPSQLAGSSAGSLIAASFNAGLDMATVERSMIEFGEDCLKHGTRYRLGPLLRDFLQQYLPADAHERCSGTTHVAVTRLLPYWQTQTVSSFESRDDLIAALLTSCHIPWYFDGRWMTKFRGRYCVDGGVMAFIPSVPEADYTVKVMCFPSSHLSALKAGTRGRRRLRRLHDLLDIDITMDSHEAWPYDLQQIVKWALVASAQETSSLLIEKGKRDAALWLEAMELAPLVAAKQQQQGQQQQQQQQEGPGQQLSGVVLPGQPRGGQRHAAGAGAGDAAAQWRDAKSSDARAAEAARAQGAVAAAEAAADDAGGGGGADDLGAVAAAAGVQGRPVKHAADAAALAEAPPASKKARTGGAAATAALGVLARVYLGLLFGGGCAAARHAGWAPCVTSAHGALFNDLPANIAGSFLMGLFVSSDVLSNSLKHTLTVEAPLAAAPVRSPLQAHTPLLVGLRTGLCGSLTTYASWNLQTVVMIVGGPGAGDVNDGWVAALCGLLIGLLCSLASLVAGQHAALLIYHRLNPGAFIPYGSPAPEQAALEASAKPPPPPPPPPPELRAGSAGSAVGRRVSTVSSTREGRTTFVTVAVEGGAADAGAADAGAAGRGEPSYLTAAGSAGSAGGSPPWLASPRSAGGAAGASVVGSPFELVAVAGAPGGGGSALLARGSAGSVQLSAPHGDWRRASAESLATPEALPSGVLAEVVSEVDVQAAEGGRPAAVVAVDALALLATAALSAVSLWRIVAGSRAAGGGAALAHADAAFAPQALWWSLLLGPAGAYARFWLSRFNGALRGGLKWFPAGTFAANMAACVMDYAVRAAEARLALGPLQTAALGGVMTGVGGCLSTVSTWVAEIQRLLLSFPNTSHGYSYVGISLASSIGLGLLIYGVPVWTA